MIVEDEELIREGMMRSIDWAAYRLRLVAAVEDGKEALVLAKELQPDIILTDVVMKEMDGIELARRLRSDIPGKDIRIIMISGHEKIEYMKSALKLHVVDYLLKPFHEEELEEVIRKVVAGLDEERERQERMRHLERKSEISQAWVREKFVEELSAGTLTPQSRDAYEELDDMFADHGGVSGGASHSSEQRKVVRAVKDIIHGAFREELSLAQLAERVHLSPNYLANLFKRETGTTINDYITEIRMAEAKRLLRVEQGILVNAVAERVGYRDGKHFTKLFKREVGMNPSEYRERS